jgi:hypothetical protein
MTGVAVESRFLAAQWQSKARQSNGKSKSTQQGRARSALESHSGLFVTLASDGQTFFVRHASLVVFTVK